MHLDKYDRWVVSNIESALTDEYLRDDFRKLLSKISRFTDADVLADYVGEKVKCNCACSDNLMDDVTRAIHDYFG